ncbi:MAG: hypothetical protein WC582_00770 [Patescibacteria group bacterium]|jgi:hypothetical protein
MEIFFYLFAVYIIFSFFLSRFFVPHLSFWQSPVPETIPREMEETIEKLKTQSSSPKEFLELSFNYLGKKYHSERLATILKFSYLFKNLENVWVTNGFIPCTQSNFLLRIFLVKSGFFREDDIRRRHVFVNFVPHQYLQVKLDDKWLDVDVGEKHRGMPIGKHLKYFG